MNIDPPPPRFGIRAWRSTTYYEKLIFGLKFIQTEYKPKNHQPWPPPDCAFTVTCPVGTLHTSFPYPFDPPIPSPKSTYRQSIKTTTKPTKNPNIPIYRGVEFFEISTNHVYVGAPRWVHYDAQKALQISCLFADLSIEHICHALNLN